MISRKNFTIAFSNYRNIKTKWMCVCYTRTNASIEEKKKAYSHTILTPKTDFPARSNKTITETIQKKAQFSELYEWQRINLKGSEFILHDGPPYANGDLHMGHAVNKIIKDINNRSQILQGNKVHYVPGWDCHGLPIELKALQKAKNTTKGDEPTDPLEIRRIARKFALETVEKQKEAFENWGVMADWKQQYYLTLNKGYVNEQLKQFYKMYQKNLVYQAMKPVYWSPSSKTALAEAELEYDANYKSTQAYVAFAFETIPEIVKDKIYKDTPVSALIWTTTPWTLIANKAICYNPAIKYSLITLCCRPREFFIVATETLEQLTRVLGIITKKCEFDGTQLSGSTYRHPLLPSPLPLLPGAHVTSERGTGLVHTAPAHGPDDFLVALNNNIPVDCNVDESGRYVNLDPKLKLNGLEVLTEGQAAVIGLLGDSVLYDGEYIHSYPLDWRTQRPVLLRASRQWFIDTAALKDGALAALDEVRILPPISADQSRLAFRTQVEKRPYWCISRQRAWGVPIPVLYVGDQAIVDDRVISKLCSLIDERGTDAWWTCDVSELLSYDVIKDYKLQGKNVVKGKDIMDIWLDSGLSWLTLGRRASLYSEGVDQLTGWFQSSLLTSLALTGQAPYESVFVHGFVVDEKRRKMSKSVGNVIDPHTIICGARKSPAYGVNVLRWWVASHATQHSQIVVSKHLLHECQNEVIRIRNMLKFLLGVVGDLQRPHFDLKPTLNFLDRYMVKECHEFASVVKEHYNNFRFNFVAQIILFFISNHVSAVYCHCVKDRLYCSQQMSNERLSAQLVIHTILVTLSKAIAPILPHLIEEAWLYHPLYEKPFYFTQNIPILQDCDINAELMETILEIKRDITLKAKNQHLKKIAARISLSSELFTKLEPLTIPEGYNDSVLCEILEISSVNLGTLLDDLEQKWQVRVVEGKRGQCMRCRKYNVEGDSDRCVRCERVTAV